MGVEHAGLAALAALRQLLGDRTQMLVINQRGDLSLREFAFGKGIEESEIDRLEERLHVHLPSAYRAILGAYNGLTLFDDPDGHQWGFHLFSVAEAVDAQEQHKRFHTRDPWPDSYVVVAHSFGDLDAIVLDTARVTHDGLDCLVLDAAAGERISAWEVADNGISTWLDRLIVSQGSKYWLWRV